MGYMEYIKRNGEYTGKIKAVPWNAAAQRRGQSKVCDSWEEADAYIQRMEREIDGHYDAAGIAVTRQQRGTPTFAEHILSARLGKPDAEKGTLRTYHAQARQLARRWPTQRVDAITEEMILDYLAELASAGLSPSTLLARLTALRHGMRQAIKLGYRADDPTFGIESPEPREHEGRILHESELMLMLVCLPSWLWPAALLSHDAGLRVGEIAGLRVFRLNLLRRVVTIADVIEEDRTLRAYPKGKEIADVPLSARVVAALSEHLRCHPPAGALAPVFSPDGRHVRPGRIRRTWDRALLLAQLPGDKPTWHDLRHSCATILAENGADPFVIKEIMRHRKLETTMRYVRRANLTRQAAAIQGAFGGSDDSSAQARASAAES